jgi:hypothetical protein
MTLLAITLRIAHVAAEFIPSNRNELRSRKGLCLQEDATGACEAMEVQLWDGKDDYDAIGTWDTTKVTALDEMFANALEFVSPIGAWDVSRVTDLHRALYSARDFNSPIGAWDVRQVTKMSQTFCLAAAFNVPLRAWDVANVETLYRTFYSAKAFAQGMPEWNVAKVTTMEEMFSKAEKFNAPVEAWDISNVKNLRATFSPAVNLFNQPIGAWNVESVTDMSDMLTGARSFKQPAWCSAAWAASTFPEYGYQGTATGSVVRCCMKGESQKFGSQVSSQASSKFCTKCSPGFFQSSDYTQTKVCTACLRDTFASGQGSFECVACDAGSYGSNVAAAVNCAICASGRRQNDLPSGTVCTNCIAGQFQPDIGKSECLKCPRGQYQPGESKQYCFPCLPGEFSNKTEAANCSQCEPGKVNAQPASTNCSYCEPGKASDARGGTKCTSCAAGMFSDVRGGRCTDCPHGRYRGSSDLTPTRCKQCRLGETTTRGRAASSCDTCGLGKFGKPSGVCAACPSKMFFSDARGLTQCTRCPLGKLANEKSTGCDAPDWKTAPICKEDGGRYLDDSDEDKYKWSCKICPTGADCLIEATKLSSGLPARAHYKKFSWSSTVFGACPAPEACLATPASSAGDRYIANVSNETNAGCAPGHDAVGSELCSQCLPGWAAMSKSSLCGKCPKEDSGLTTFIIVVLLIMVLIAFSFLVWDNLMGSQHMVEAAAAAKSCPVARQRITMPYHSIAIRIVSSYLQVAGLTLYFDLTLPRAARNLAVVEASSSSLSESLTMFDCATSIRKDIQIFTLKQIMSTWVIPCSGVCCCALFWFVISKVYNGFRGGGAAAAPPSAAVAAAAVAAATANADIRNKTLVVSAGDNFLASLMILFYTLFPSLVTRVALSFSCRTYGGQQLLTEALSVKCWDSVEHGTMVGAVGVPGILLFIVIIPGMIGATLVRQRKRERLYPSQKHYDPRWTVRFGFMFAGYEEGFEYWETVVMCRKCAIVLMTIFLRSSGPAPQVVAASLILIAALSAQLQYMPYEDPSHDALESVGLHACLIKLLVALMANMVGRADPQVTDSPLGPVSTAVVIIVSFGFTIYFIWFAVVSTIRSSLEAKGLIGGCARRCAKLPICKQMVAWHVNKESERVKIVVRNGPTLASPQSKSMKRVTTKRGSLRYNAKVALHMGRAEQETKNYVKSLKERELDVEKKKVEASKRLQRRIDERHQRLGRSAVVPLSAKSSPAPAPAPVTSSMETDAPTKDAISWQSVLDPASGKTYYYDALNDPSCLKPTWDKPNDYDIQTAAREEQAEQFLATHLLYGEEIEEVTSSADGAQWTEVADATSGRMYYYNKQTHETTWEDPSTAASEIEERVLPPDPTAISKMVSSWQSVLDPASGKYYYYDAEKDPKCENPVWVNPAGSDEAAANSTTDTAEEKKNNSTDSVQKAATPVNVKKVAHV